MQIVNIPYGTKEWKEFRLNGIGGSEAGYVMDIGSKYNDPVKIYYEKTGISNPPDFDNEAMMSGRDLEDYVADMRWSYWSGSPESVVENRSKNNIVRTSSKIEGFIISDDYPFLFASLDRIASEKQIIDFNTGEISPDKFILEIKTIRGHEARKWERGYPEQYYWQVLQYMIVLKLKYAEIAVLTDGAYFNVYPVHYNQYDADRYINKASAFWDRICMCREGLKEVNKLALSVAEKLQMIDVVADRFAPETMGGDSYQSFMAERAKQNNNANKLKGTETDISLLRDYATLLSLNNTVESLKNRIKASFTRTSVINKSDEIDCGEWGRIDYKKARATSSDLSCIPRPSTLSNPPKNNIEFVKKQISSILLTKFN